MYDIYRKCPQFSTEVITLRLTSDKDTEDLLKCYSDIEAVPFFNADNCNGDDFYYTSLERMRQAVDFWEDSYQSKQFVRMTVIYNQTKEKIGTIEMFNRGNTRHYGKHGLLRIDLRSQYERKNVIEEILDLANLYFYEVFGVDYIITKAIKSAGERILSLQSKGYDYLNQFERPDYYGRLKD